MVDKLNPGEKTAAESDYDKKFNRQFADGETKKDDLKSKEAAGDAKWLTKTEVKKKDGKKQSKGRFGFVGRRAGRIRQGSAFAFIIGMLALGVWYTSVFAPNIMLVNIKEMYTNDLSDATIALNSYYWKMMNYKIGHSQCGDSPIKCKLSTMSSAQKRAFEQHGFTVLGSQVSPSQTGDTSNPSAQAFPRYQVSAIIPPASSPGMAATGDMLWLYGQKSSANKTLLYSVFNPKSSFFMDTRFKQRIQSKYGLTKSLTVGGETDQQIDQSFDASMKGGGGIDQFGRPNLSSGISLASLGSPVTLAELEAAVAPLAAEANSFVGLQCAYYSLGKQVTNDAKVAEAATVARFAMQYLKAADQIKAGTSQDVTISAMSSKLGQSVSGDYGSGSATDDSIYKSITYGSAPIPSPFGILNYLDAYDIIGAMAPAWLTLMASATAEGKASNVQGNLLMPPFTLTGQDRDYCLGGETQQNHTPIKMNTEEKCAPEILASAFPGTEGLLAPVVAQARQTCPVQHYDDQDHTTEGEFLMQPSVKATAAIESPIVAAAFGANVVAWANARAIPFSSQQKGESASATLFAGTGEILGDMAESRGMMPSNAAYMTVYLAQKDKVQKDFDEVAQYNARKNPLDPYNKFSFLGSIVHGLSPTYDDSVPLLATLSNSLNVLASSIKLLNPSANAIYYTQPDPFNPARMTCPDAEYLAIGITADTACNVRYSLSPIEMTASLDSVLDYMTQTHSDAYQDEINELTQRQAQADPEGDAANVGRMLQEKIAVSQQPFIDKNTGKPIQGSEYDKFVEYCVDRQDPWGRSGLHVVRRQPTPEEIRNKLGDKDNNLDAVSPQDSGYPWGTIPVIDYPSITEGAKADQDWYTGKKCTEQSQMLQNFREYTMACSVDGSLSGGLNCSDPDNALITSYSNDFYTNNDILYVYN